MPIYVSITYCVRVFYKNYNVYRRVRVYILTLPSFVAQHLVSELHVYCLRLFLVVYKRLIFQHVNNSVHIVKQNNYIIMGAYNTDHAELIFERRVRAILLEKPTCETQDLEYSNARLLELEITSSALTRGYVRYSYTSCTSNVGGL